MGVHSICIKKKIVGYVYDCRAVNKNTIVDSYPLQSIDKLFSKPWGAKYFSKLNFQDRYFHVPIPK